MNPDLITRQQDVCAGAVAPPAFLSPTDRVAIGRDFDPTRYPINGLRNPAYGNMCGWSIWSGKVLSQEADYFNVICYEHLVAKGWDWVDYLALPVGWRFLVAPGYKDIWFDQSLFDEAI